MVDLARRTLLVIRQNVALSMLTKALALSLAGFGFVNLWIAVLVDVGATLVVTLNGLRLARIEAQPPTDEESVPARVPAACGCGDSVHEHAQAADQARRKVA